MFNYEAGKLIRSQNSVRESQRFPVSIDPKSNMAALHKNHRDSCFKKKVKKKLLLAFLIIYSTCHLTSRTI